MVHSLVVALADDPNLADWIAAVGQAVGALFTAAAVGVAVWLGWRDRRWRREDQAANRAEQADRDAAQARLVTVAASYDGYSWDPRVNVFTVTAHNGSSDPIFEVEIVSLEAEGHEGQAWEVDWGPFDPEFERARLLLSGKSHSLPVSYVDEGRKNVTIPAPDHVTVRFTDASGLRWERTDHHAPVRLIDGS